MPLPQQTALWTTAFDAPRADTGSQEQTFFRIQLELMRERVEPVVARIFRDMPGYTVHDITHLDALWDTASLIGRGRVDLNPPEAFVFGAAVLLHDAAMTIAAYPNGLGDIKGTSIWSDVYELNKLRMPQGEPEAIQSATAIEVMRRLHAVKANELPLQYFNVPTAAGYESQYLIENSDLRHYYGPTIGAIAHSHWWPIDRVERELDSRLGGYVPKTNLQVDKLKLACLLRVADALHLDRRRAPPFVRALENPKGISDLHWSFQGRMGLPHLEGDAVVFTAAEPTSEGESDAWWLAFDAISMADKEVRDAGLLLRERRHIELAATRVKGAESPAELAKSIPVQGWRPVEARIRANDIGRIVDALGGVELYGSDSAVPLRELLQNSADAIQARRMLQARASGWGEIRVSLFEGNEGVWLSVEDNGVGMSERVLTGTFLDFGTSLWRCAEVLDEFPQLLGRGMAPAGRYGIGFFSVFMIGDYVRVISRRYDAAADSAQMLTFKNGIASRPTLALVPTTDAPVDGGTRVEILLRRNPIVKEGLKLFTRDRRMSADALSMPSLRESRNRTFPTLAALCRFIAPTSSVDIIADQFGQCLTAVSANDWLQLPPDKLIERIGKPVAGCEELISEINDGDKVIGRAALWPAGEFFSGGVICSKGFRVQSVPYIVGILDGEVTTVARDLGVAAANKASFRAWATQQRQLIERSDMDALQKARSAEIILECGAEVGELPLARRAGQWLNSNAFVQLIASCSEIAIFVGDVDHEDSDPVGRDIFSSGFRENQEVVFVPTLRHPLVGRDDDRWMRGSYILGLLLGLIELAWEGRDEYEEFDFVIGSVSYEDIIRSVTVYQRPGSGF